MKKTLALVLVLAASSLLAGCGKSNHISRSDRNQFARACTQSGGANQETCNCVADLAREQLSPHTFDMVLASIRGDTQRATELQGELTMNEAQEAGQFMFNAFATCANAGNGSGDTSKK